MALDKRRVLKMALGIMGGTLILLIIGTAVPAWGTGPDKTIGLFEECLHTHHGSVCESLVCDDRTLQDTEDCGRMVAGRVFMAMACFLSGISTIFFMLCLANGELLPVTVLRCIKWLPTVSFVSALIGVASGIAFVTNRGGLSLGVGAVFGIIALVVSLFGAGVAAIIPTAYEVM